MSIRRLTVVFVFASSVVSLSLAADWAQWRGPHRNGISSESGLARDWPEAGPKLVWESKELGSGYGSPAIVGNRIYILGNEGYENEFCDALDATNGKRLWRQKIGKVGNPEQNPNYPAARSTPTVDGDRMYVFGSDGDIACLETATGKPKWAKNVRQEFGGQPGDWAYSESPLVDGERVVCTPGGPEAMVVAFNKNTGDVIWKFNYPEGKGAGYSSLVPIENGGKKQYVQYLAEGIVGVDAETGKLAWQFGASGRGDVNIATPVSRDGFVYTAAQVGARLIKLPADGGAEAEQVYVKRGLPNAIGGSVLIGDNLYGTTRQDGLVCVDFKTGEVKWKNRSIGVGSVCSAGGLLFIHGENGDIAMVEATADEYREKGRFVIPNKPKPKDQMEKSWAYPALANGRLYVRDKNMLWCFDVSERASPN